MTVSLNTQIGQAPAKLKKASKVMNLTTWTSKKHKYFSKGGESFPPYPGNTYYRTAMFDTSL